MHRDIEILSKFPREHWLKVIDQWVFDEQARYALKRNFLDKIPYEKIGEELGISRLTVHNKIEENTEYVYLHRYDI